MVVGVILVSMSRPMPQALGAQDSENSLWGWGDNRFGAVGDGTNSPRNGAVPVKGPSDALDIDAGGGHSLAIRSGGMVVAWGANSVGQLGDGTTVNRPTPVAISGLTDVKIVTAGGDRSLAVKNDGSVWAWGNNRKRLGVGDDEGLQIQPARVRGRDGEGFFEAVDVSAGDQYQLALKADGSIWAWGANSYNSLGAYGDGQTGEDKPTPYRIDRAGPGPFKAIATGWAHGMAVASDTTVWTWGLNTIKQLGHGVAPGSCGNMNCAPNQVVGPEGYGRFSAVRIVDGGFDHSLALREDGSVWAWGSNEFGQLGVGDRPIQVCVVEATNIQVPCSPTPIPVSGMTGVKAIAAGYNWSLALKLDGSLWAWGQNSLGELGAPTSQMCDVRHDPTLLNTSKEPCSRVPIKVAAGGGSATVERATLASAGYFHAVALVASRLPPPCTGDCGGGGSGGGDTSGAGGGTAGERSPPPAGPPGGGAPHAPASASGTATAPGGGGASASAASPAPVTAGGGASSGGPVGSVANAAAGGSVSAPGQAPAAGVVAPMGQVNPLGNPVMGHLAQEQPDAAADYAMVAHRGGAALPLPAAAVAVTFGCLMVALGAGTARRRGLWRVTPAVGWRRSG